MMTGPVENIASLFENEGAREYAGEVVSLSTHMLQAAAHAEASGADDHLVAAALLHDVGHLPSVEMSGDHHHEEIGADWLAQWLPVAVTGPVRLHVAAKRYLCAVDPTYLSALSPASVQSLKVQGGAMTQQEAGAFESRPYAEDAVAVRRWDDLAKDPTAHTPEFAHYVPLLQRLMDHSETDRM